MKLISVGDDFKKPTTIVNIISIGFSVSNFVEHYSFISSILVMSFIFVNAIYFE